jgi:hypothetical protein
MPFLALGDDHERVISRCKASATVVLASSHRSTSADVDRMTGMALEWIAMTAFAFVVREPEQVMGSIDGRTLG